MLGYPSTMPHPDSLSDSLLGSGCSEGPTVCSDMDFKTFFQNIAGHAIQDDSLAYSGVALAKQGLVDLTNYTSIDLADISCPDQQVQLQAQLRAQTQTPLNLSTVLPHLDTMYQCLRQRQSDTLVHIPTMKSAHEDLRQDPLYPALLSGLEELKSISTHYSMCERYLKTKPASMLLTKENHPIETGYILKAIAPRLSEMPTCITQHAHTKKRPIRSHIGWINWCKGVLSTQLHRDGLLLPATPEVEYLFKFFFALRTVVLTALRAYTVESMAKEHLSNMVLTALLRPSKEYIADNSMDQVIWNYLQSVSQYNDHLVDAPIPTDVLSRQKRQACISTCSLRSMADLFKGASPSGTVPNRVYQTGAPFKSLSRYLKVYPTLLKIEALHTEAIAKAQEEGSLYAPGFVSLVSMDSALELSSTPPLGFTANTSLGQELLQDDLTWVGMLPEYRQNATFTTMPDSIVLLTLKHQSGYRVPLLFRGTEHKTLQICIPTTVPTTAHILKMYGQPINPVGVHLPGALCIFTQLTNTMSRNAMYKLLGGVSDPTQTYSESWYFRNLWLRKKFPNRKNSDMRIRCIGTGFESICTLQKGGSTMSEAEAWAPNNVFATFELMGIGNLFCDGGNPKPASVVLADIITESMGQHAPA